VATIVGSELKSLYNLFLTTGAAKTDDIFQVFGSGVLVEVYVPAGMYTTPLNLLTNSYGMSDIVEDDGMVIITGKNQLLTYYL